MRGLVRRQLVLMLVVTFVTKASTAHADRLLFESYVGNRPAEAARIAPLIRTVFERHGFTTDPLVLAMIFREHAYRPGLGAPYFAERLKRIAQRAEDLFWDENYLKVIEDLGNLIIAMRQNPLTFAKEPKYREVALRALVFYALACSRQAKVLAAEATKADEAAKFERLRDDTLAEIMRSFPSKIFTKKEFGDEGVKLLSDARGQVSRGGRGRISITTSDRDALIYLDEIAQGTAKADVDDLIPGVYRVLIVVPSGEAREYQVEVTANQISRFAEDWGIDSLLVLGSAYAGFKYRTEKDHALEATLVQTLAQAHTNASIAATITITYTRGRFGVTGTSYDAVTGQILQSGHVELTGSPPNDTMINRLAECLIAAVGETCAEGVLPVSHPEFTPPPPPPPPKPDDSPFLPVPEAPPSVTARKDDSPGAARSWPKWLSAGGSAALVVGGAYLVNKGRHQCGLPGSDCQIPLSYAVGGYAALDAAVALGAMSVYWFYAKDLRPEKAPARWLVIGGSAALAAGAVVYAFDQDPSPTKRYYWDTAPTGVALGALGLASIGVGAWCWTRSAHSAPVPTVSVTSSQAMLEWSGSF